MINQIGHSWSKVFNVNWYETEECLSIPEIAQIINDGKNWNSNVCKVTVVASVTKCACSGTSHTTTALVCKISKKCIKEGLQEDNNKEWYWFETRMSN